jgi:hypothetical protein
VFRLLLLVAGNLRGVFVVWAHAWPYIGWLGPVTIGLLSAAFARLMVVRLSPLAEGSGVQNVEVRRCRWSPLSLCSSLDFCMRTKRIPAFGAQPVPAPDLQNTIYPRSKRSDVMPTMSETALNGLLVVGIVMIGTLPGFARDKYETIDAQAFGTGTQMGQNIGVTLNIYEFSTPADRVTLLQSFEKGQNQGLVNALQKMKAIGHVEITGTLGYDALTSR